MYVYTITNVADGKVYVGKSRVPRSRWARHKLDAATGETMLYRAMRKHGVAAFRFEIVEQCADDDASFEAEKRWIAKLSANEPGNGYNHTEGGPGMPRPDQVTRGRMGSGMRGKKQTRESVAKRAAANRGQKRTPETCALLSQRRREISDETRAKMSAAAKKRWTGPAARSEMLETLHRNREPRRARLGNVESRIKPTPKHASAAAPVAREKRAPRPSKALKLERIRELHSLGLTNTRIAKRIGCSQPLVCRYLREMGLCSHGKCLGP